MRSSETRRIMSSSSPCCALSQQMKGSGYSPSFPPRVRPHRRECPPSSRPIAVEKRKTVAATLRVSASVGDVSILQERGDLYEVHYTPSDESTSVHSLPSRSLRRHVWSSTAHFNQRHLYIFYLFIFPFHLLTRTPLFSPWNPCAGCVRGVGPRRRSGDCGEEP